MNTRKHLLPLLGAIVIMSISVPASAHLNRKEDASRPAVPGVVNVNTATPEQLALLPGVGPTRAAAIIQARENRPFRTVQELMRVRGIGRATLEQLRPYVTVDGETTLSQPIRRSRSE